MEVLFRSVNLLVTLLFCSFVFIEVGGFVGYKIQKWDAGKVVERAKQAELTVNDRLRLNKLCEERLNFKTNLYSCPN